MFRHIRKVRSYLYFNLVNPGTANPFLRGNTDDFEKINVSKISHETI